MDKSVKNKAIKNKLANLIFSSPKDMCIKSRISNRSLDLFKFFPDNQIDDFFAGKKENLELSLSMSKDLLERDLRSLNDVKSFLDYLDSNEIIIAKSKKDKLVKKFDENKDSIIALITSKGDNQRRKIESIIKRNKSIAENTGVHSLYITSYFLNGITNTGIVIKAPLVLYPIEISTSKNGYIITRSLDNFIINEKVLALFKKDYNLKTQIVDLVKEVRQKENFDLIINEFKKCVDIKNTLKGLKPTEFVENTNLSTSDGFELTKHFILGIFEPTGGALKDDLEKLIEKDIDPFLSAENFSKSKFINDEINNVPITQIGSELNIYQKYAIRSALSQNTLIFGPPGTGKSQVITNIVANALLTRKSTLVVAEKKVALDVVIERLNDLSSFTLYIDNLKNKSDFYEKILWIADKLENMHFDIAEVNNNYDELINMRHVSNVSHDNLKNYFSFIQDIIQVKDSAGTSFLEYLSLTQQVDKNLLKFIKDNNSLNYINRMIELYSFKDVSMFFEKIREYKSFLVNFKIDMHEANNFLKWQKIALTEFQVQFNTLVFFEDFASDIKGLYRKFNDFLEQNKLNNNRKFLKSLKENVNLLKTQKIILEDIRNKYHGLFNKGFLQYLVDMPSKIEAFLIKYRKQPEIEKEAFLVKYLKDTKFYTKYVGEENNNIVKYGYESYIDIMEKFIKLPANEYEYLPNLLTLENSNIIDQNIVLLHFNPWLKETYIEQLGKSNFTFFSSQDLLDFAPIEHMNVDDYEKYIKIIRYETEVAKTNQLANTDIKQLVDSYRSNLQLDNNDSTKKLSYYYLQSLKMILNDMNPASKKKMQEVFAIARRDSKNNVSIKDFIANYYNELKIIFPIWISLPELIAQLLPLKENIFDYGIFDEASQIFMERAYPIVYRCKTNIVAGDDKQLKPTSFFASRIDDTTQNYEFADNDQVDSLLDRAKVALWPSYHLRNHYRSIHRDLIQFSNDYVYENNLNFVTKNGAPNNTFEIFNVDGINVDGINEVEGNAVYDLLKENISKYKKIIVVTFGTKQSSYIEQIIQKSSLDQPLINQKYTSGDLIISNLENVQGNESDLVILSVTYGKDQSNNFKNNFGPLLMYGGINRLNVAITRAKDKMIVVKSFMVSEMTFNQENENAAVLREFINYCDNMEFNLKNHEVIKTKPSVSSIIHDELYMTLQQKVSLSGKYYLVKNYDIGSTVLDFAILEKDTNRTMFAILINKLSNQTNVVSLFETIDNYFFILDRNYKCFLLDEHYWIKNKSMATNKIVAELENIL